MSINSTARSFPISSPSITPELTSTTQPTIQITDIPTPTATPIPSILGDSFDPALDLRAGPVSLPLQIQIPVLDVEAPILGVGLTEDNAMDAPKGSFDDPIWSSAFWYRGSAIPGQPGTSTIAAHVDGMLGQPETFAQIHKLKPGDEIIIKSTFSTYSLTFIVDEVKVYSLEESSFPVIMARIFGTNNINNKPLSADDLSHLTLITCAGQIIKGEFNHHTVVFSTLKK